MERLVYDTLRKGEQQGKKLTPYAKATKVAFEHIMKCEGCPSTSKTCEKGSELLEVAQREAAKRGGKEIFEAV